MAINKLLELQLMGVLNHYLLPNGFKRTGRQLFEKPIAIGKAAIHVAFIRHVNDSDATIDVGIRIDALEDLLYKSESRSTAKQVNCTYSMGAELGNLVNRQPERWTIATEDDIEPVAVQMWIRIEAIAFPYIYRFGQLENALEVLSSDEPNAWIHSPFHAERAKGAIGLAYLIGDQTKLQSIVNSQILFLERRKDADLEDVRQFIRSLGLSVSGGH